MTAVDELLPPRGYSADDLWSRQLKRVVGFVRAAVDDPAAADAACGRAAREFAARYGVPPEYADGLATTVRDTLDQCNIVHYFSRVANTDTSWALERDATRQTASHPVDAPREPKSVEPSAPVRRRGAHARASRGRPTRRRGSRRNASRAGPPGDDDAPGEPEPPHLGRLDVAHGCGCCNAAAKLDIGLAWWAGRTWCWSSRRSLRGAGGILLSNHGKHPARRSRPCIKYTETAPATCGAGQKANHHG